MKCPAYTPTQSANRAKAVVRESLKKLGVTRVVIAHRLSTFRNVDRVYVLEGGCIVETRYFDQLMKRDGMFAALPVGNWCRRRGMPLRVSGCYRPSRWK